MADRQILIQQNGRMTTRGLFMDQGYPAMWKDKDETLTIDVDWSRWLGSDTISTSTWATDDSVTVDSESETTTVATVTISGDSGSLSKLTNTMTSAAGLVKQQTIRIKGRDA